LARARPLVPPGGSPGGQLAQPSQAEPPQDPPDGGAAERHGRGDPSARPVLPPQRLDVRHDGGGRRPRRPVGPTRAIGEPRHARLPGPRQPLAHRSLAHPDRLGDPPHPPPLPPPPPDDLRSTGWRGPGILVDVHPGLPPWVDGWRPTTSFPVRTRMDRNNLLSLHT